MPSPVAHTAIGYVIYRLVRRDKAQRLHFWEEKFMGLFPYSLLYTIGISLLPDLDALAGLIYHDFGRFHNNGTHSLFVGLAFSLVIAAVFYWSRRQGFLSWFLITLLGYELHVIMDFLTFGGRGVMLFWPLLTNRFQSPILVFYGVRWSEGLFTFQHVITIATELVFVIAVVLLLKLLLTLRSSDKNKQQFSGSNDMIR